MWSLLAVLVSVSVMFHFMFVHYTFSSVWVAEWQPLGIFMGGEGAGRFFEKNKQDSDKDKQNRQDDQANKKISRTV